MYSNNQIFKKYIFFRKRHNTSSMLRMNPHKKGQISRLRINTPRKPNSARRKTAKLLFSNGCRPVVYIPGGKHGLKRFSSVLVRGRGPRDTPGVYLSAIRGQLDLFPNEDASKRNRKSVYGHKSIEPKIPIRKRLC